MMQILCLHVSVINLILSNYVKLGKLAQALMIGSYPDVLILTAYD